MSQMIPNPRGYGFVAHTELRRASEPLITAQPAVPQHFLNSPPSHQTFQVTTMYHPQFFPPPIQYTFYHASVPYHTSNGSYFSPFSHGIPSNHLQQYGPVFPTTIQSPTQQFLVSPPPARATIQYPVNGVQLPDPNQNVYGRRPAPKQESGTLNQSPEKSAQMNQSPEMSEQNLVKRSTSHTMQSVVEIPQSQSVSQQQAATAVPKVFETAQLKRMIARQFQCGENRRDSDFLDSLFKKHAVENERIKKEQLLDALKEVIPHVKEQDIAEFFKTADLNSDGVLDLEEFKVAVQKSSRVVEWTRSLPFADLLADCFPAEHDGDPLRSIGQLTDEQVLIVGKCYCDKVMEKLPVLCGALRAGFTSIDRPMQHDNNDSAAKFEIGKMNCGSILDYHEGLHKRIGTCNLEFEKAMKQEHCSKAGHDQEFETTNYRIKTNPKREWGIVVDGLQPNDYEMRERRKIQKIEDMMKLETALKAKLAEAEIIAIALYTGPMFQVYNTILRQDPPNLYKIFFDGDNLFSTTIYTLVSAVHKISRIMVHAPGIKLYRGLGGKHDLPESFYKRDENGCRGFADWGFMSTTGDKTIAINFSGLKENRPAPIVLEISFGAVDRGACIRDFSQYPREVEYLYPPCSFLEQSSPEYLELTKHGIVKVFPVKVNTNGKTLTIEELVSQKKNMHIAAFSYSVEEIRSRLTRMAEEKNAQERLLKDSSRDPSHTVEAFLKRIAEQCVEVLNLHKAVNSNDYTKDSIFRNLVMEMLDVQTMAMSKLEEWLENQGSSFILYRLNAPLRTANRRWTAYLQHMCAEAKTDEERKKNAVRVCKVKGLIVDSVEELNELKENRLMALAAEGCAGRDVQTLVAAGALVNAARPDGVTPLWLAAQFGHVVVVEELVALKADVNLCANDLASPVYIAAQGGNVECITKLVELKADILAADRKGLTPLHQAAMNLHARCVEFLLSKGANPAAKDTNGKTAVDLVGKRDCPAQKECIQLLRAKGGSLVASTAPDNGRSIKSSAAALIISTGDISDADGFMALAEYARTGADALFVMNYPAYIGIHPADVNDKFADLNPGLGYKFSAKEVFANVKNPTEEYLQFMERYKDVGENDNERMKGAMTDLAFWMAKNVWNEFKPESKPAGCLYFCIGGINTINPFSPTAIKNEVEVYSAMKPDVSHRLPTQEGVIYDEAGQAVELDWEQYKEVYMDFNGSMAFFNDDWLTKLSEVATKERLKGVFVMGGVWADTPPVTMPAIPGRLNRFSTATMNQLYHPQNAANFFAFLGQRKDVIKVYTVTNNIVNDIGDKDDRTGAPVSTLNKVKVFLERNDLAKGFLKAVAEKHYLSPGNPPRKPYDFYTALALTCFMRDRNSLIKAATKHLYYSNVYGISCVSSRSTWEETLAALIAAVDVTPRDTDDERARERKELFRTEIDLMRKIDDLGALPVLDLTFRLDPATLKLSIPH